MFIGHAAVALAVRPKVPGRSLGVLFAAAYLIDLVWPVLLLLGIETVVVEPGNTAFTPLAFVHYPWTHSLLAVFVWAVLFALVVMRPPRSRGEFLVLSGLVVSHWLLDFLTHRPDLPLYPGSATMAGLSLWQSVPATLIVEGGLFAAALVIYTRTSAPADRTGTVAFWWLVALLVVIWASGPFSPPPPNASAIGVVGLLTWLIPVWAHWADRHRVLRAGGALRTMPFA